MSLLDDVREILDDRSDDRDRGDDRGSDLEALLEGMLNQVLEQTDVTGAVVVFVRGEKGQPGMSGVGLSIIEMVGLLALAQTMTVQGLGHSVMTVEEEGEGA